MRVLSALVLTHCFGCIIPEDTDDEIVHCKLLAPHQGAIGENSKVLQISSSEVPDLVSADTDEPRELRYGRRAMESQTTDKDGQGGLMDIAGVDGNLPRYRHTSGSLDTRETGSIYLLPERSPSVNTRENGTQVDARQISSWHLRRKRERLPSRIVSRQSAREMHRMIGKRQIERDPCSRGREVARRKRHLDRDYRSYRTAPGKKNRGYSGARGISGRAAREDDSEDGDIDGDAEDDAATDAGDWDEWTEWSECSASCGCGRQVRWRHCTGKGCANGIKKAQIRTCHLKDCNSKSLLSWLGVKA